MSCSLSSSFHISACLIDTVVVPLGNHGSKSASRQVISVSLIFCRVGISYSLWLGVPMGFVSVLEATLVKMHHFEPISQQASYCISTKILTCSNKNPKRVAKSIVLKRSFHFRYSNPFLVDWSRSCVHQREKPCCDALATQ